MTAQIRYGDGAGEDGRRLAATQALAHVGWWEWPLHGERATWSDETCRIYGCEPGFGPTPQQFAALVHPDDRALFTDPRWYEDPREVAFRIVRPDGEIRHAVTRSELRRDASGDTVALFGVTQDVTERERALVERDEARQGLRDALDRTRRERDQAKAIIAAMPEGCMLTFDGEIIAVNEAFCEMVGFSAAELVGLHPPYPFWAPEAAQELVEVRRALAASEGGCLIATCRRRDGSRFESQTTAQVVKDSDGEKLGFVHVVRDVTEHVRQRRELERRARTDALTGLPNRTMLEEALAREVSRRGDDRRLALVLLDLDNFKEINDLHGHPIGDAVLVEVAERLARTVRRGEVLARLGGEEFAWLLPDAGPREASAAADRARATIACRPFRGAGALTVSAGVGVVGTPFDGELLYELADRAVYDAKQQGRNRTCRAIAGFEEPASDDDRSAAPAPSTC